MLLSVFDGRPIVQAGVGVAVFAFAVAVALLVTRVIIPLATRLTKKTETTLDDLILHALSTPIAVLIVSQGMFSALTALSALDGIQKHVNTAWVATTTAVIVWLIQRLVNALLTWYGHEVAVKTKTNWDDQALPILRRVLSFLILAIGLLIILSEAGFSISPLLASLGIGGLAVALALQPTLANFFAGTSVLSDGSVRPADFIELQGGPMGTVQEVGWRSTRIITPAGNVVIIPNSKLADSIVTNFHQPDQEMNLAMTCGVSYEADLEKVERVSKEVMREVRDGSPQAIKTFEPVVLFREFGDSNITFLLIMRGTSRGGTFPLQSELVKAISRRFQQEGIEINYPVRKLVYPADDSTDGATPRGLVPPEVAAGSTAEGSKEAGGAAGGRRLPS